MKRNVLIWEVIGVIVISVLGSVLHFVFEWSGAWAPAGIFAAVNESVWEHLKLAYWPALIYGALEYRHLKGLTRSFTVAKAAGIYVMPISIALIFYSYTQIVGHEILLVDILTFWLAVALGQLASYRLMTSSRRWGHLHAVALTSIVLLGIGFALFTFYPPHLPIFQDPITGGYGIVE